MGRMVIPRLLFLLLGHILCSGSTIKVKETLDKNNSTQRDITTPIITPSTPTTPTVTPNSTPGSPAYVIPTTSNPTTTTTPPASGSASWCVATQTASETALQVALDYACGYGGADCSAIQTGGACYNPNTIHDHASFAFNNYFQKSPLPTSCNFGGNAVITTSDPSSGACQYPSTSTSSSVLNTTSPSGSTVFGSTPSSSSVSATVVLCSLPHLFITTCLVVSFLLTSYSGKFA